MNKNFRLNKESKTQNGFLYIIEKIIRCHPLLYIITRSLVRFTNIFEADFIGLKLINLKKKLEYTMLVLVMELLQNFF